VTKSTKSYKNKKETTVKAHVATKDTSGTNALLAGDNSIAANRNAENRQDSTMKAILIFASRLLTDKMKQ
jgi:hypothetical protein